MSAQKPDITIPFGFTVGPATSRTSAGNRADRL